MANKYVKVAEQDYQKASAEKLRVSFDYIDWDLPELFFIHGLEEAHYKKLFECLAELGSSTEDEIVQQKHYSLIPKSIFNTDGGTVNEFPKGIQEAIRQQIAKGQNATAIDAANLARDAVRRAFEIRVAKSYGRIHGFVWNKIFHVVWFDPAHNLYPRKETGVRSPEKYATVKGFSHEEVFKMQEENRRLVDSFNTLKKEHEELMQVFCNQ